MVDTCFMMTSWHAIAFRITGLLERNPPATCGFPSQRTSDAELWCFSDVSPNKLLNKQASCRCFDAPWGSCDITVMAFVCATNFSRNQWQLNVLTHLCVTWSQWVISPMVIIVSLKSAPDSHICLSFLHIYLYFYSLHMIDFCCCCSLWYQ